jgi:hypothetical protein
MSWESTVFTLNVQLLRDLYNPRQDSGMTFRRNCHFLIAMKLENLGVGIVKRTGEVTAGPSRFAGEHAPNLDHDNSSATSNEVMCGGNPRYARSDHADIGIDMFVKLCRIADDYCTARCAPRRACLTGGSYKSI